MDLRNTFIRTKDAAHSKAFQEHVFKMGIEWGATGKCLSILEGQHMIEIDANLSMYYITTQKNRKETINDYENVLRVMVDNGLIEKD